MARRLSFWPLGLGLCLACLMACQSAPGPAQRWSPPALNADVPLRTIFENPPALDLEHWSFGFVTIPELPARLGIPGRFWSDRKPLWIAWREAQGPSALAIAQLQRHFAQASGPLEAFWLAVVLNRAYLQAGVFDEARSWLAKARALHDCPFLQLEQAWDAWFRQADRIAAQAQFRQLGATPDLAPEDRMRWQFLRKALYFRAIPTTALGLDSYLSNLILDQDDLWLATWNGGLARWSLTTSVHDVFLQPDRQIEPIHLIRATEWFLYVFKDKVLSRYSKVTGKWRDFPYPEGWSGLRVQDAVFVSSEEFWVAHLGAGLWHWQAGAWTDFSAGSPSLFLNVLLARPEGGLYVGTRDQGLWQWGDGHWQLLVSSGLARPLNISALAAAPDASKIAVGTYGEGLWLLTNGQLTPLSLHQEYVTAAVWTPQTLWWATLDQGFLQGEHQPLRPLDISAGIPGATGAAVVGGLGRVFWGTESGDVGEWTEDDDSPLHR